MKEKIIDLAHTIKETGVIVTPDVTLYFNIYNDKGDELDESKISLSLAVVHSIANQLLVEEEPKEKNTIDFSFDGEYFLISYEIKEEKDEIFNY